MKNTQNYEDFKRDLAVRILRVIANKGVPVAVCGAVEEIVKTLDEFLPKDESDKRGPYTSMIDLVPVYEVDCPKCEEPKAEYTDVHPFCKCGYCFN